MSQPAETANDSYFTLRDSVFKSAGNIKQHGTYYLLATLGEEWNMRQFLAASARWHKSIGNNAARASADCFAFLEWPALCAPVKSTYGYTITALTSSAELREEGRAMCHCVGSYSSICHTGGSHIFSIRKGEDRISTLEITARDSLNIKIGQHYTKYNRRPPAGAIWTAEWFLGELKSGSIKIDWKTLNNSHRKAKKDSSLISLVGFDPFRNNAWERSFLEFSSYLPGKLKNLHPMEFVKASAERLLKSRFPLSNVDVAALKMLRDEDLKFPTQNPQKE